jgi:hypothetical protein
MRNQKATEILFGERFILDVLAAALKEEVLERTDKERIIQGTKE